MKVDEKILGRFDDLLKRGEQVLSTKRSPPPNVFGDYRVDSQLAYQWATNVQNLFSNVFGTGSVHYVNFKKQVDSHLSYSPVYRAQGILKAAKDDYENGHIFELKTLVEAEVFDDFLEQATHLLSNGYYQPAAVIAGCVLEDGLKQLCIKSLITLSDKPKLDSMNSELAKNGTYNKLMQKKITALADLRNKAAHGEWNEFDKDDVEEMIDSVRKFMLSYYA